MSYEIFFSGIIRLKKENFYVGLYFCLEQRCAILTAMKTWRERLQQAGLLDFAGLVLDVVEPLAPIGAQMLWVAQPTLGLLVAPEKIASWAELLENPQQIARLREQIEREDSSHDQ